MALNMQLDKRLSKLETLIDPAMLILGRPGKNMFPITNIAY